MNRITYVNGRYLPHRHAGIHVEDRGYQFADGVYEVIAVYQGRLVDADAHLDRLDRSLSALAIPWPMSRCSLCAVVAEVIRRNRISGSGAVYLQVTRGVAPRAHQWGRDLRPTLVISARLTATPVRERLLTGIAVVSARDLRWRRPDIKSVALLPNVLARQAAADAGAGEAWLVDDAGRITEGTTSNAWIVTADGELVTRQTGPAILAGITREAIVRLAGGEGLVLRERPFSVAEALAAREAFATSTTAMVRPVIRLDGRRIGDGRPGPVTRQLIDLYLDHLAGGPDGIPATRGTP